MINNKGDQGQICERKSASTISPLPIIELLVAFPEIDFKKYLQASRHKMERAIQMVFKSRYILSGIQTIIEMGGRDHTFFLIPGTNTGTQKAVNAWSTPSFS